MHATAQHGTAQHGTAQQHTAWHTQQRRNISSRAMPCLALLGQGESASVFPTLPESCKQPAPWAARKGAAC